MKYFFKTSISTAIILLSLSDPSQDQHYDVLLKGGHLIDPKNSIDKKLDVAILDGKIAAVALQIPEDKAKKTIHTQGLYITPGLIDIHAHVFWGTKSDAYISNSYTSLPPDGFTFRAGVTTAVDAGSSGWRNFRVFKEQTIDRGVNRGLSSIFVNSSEMSFQYSPKCAARKASSS